MKIQAKKQTRMLVKLGATYLLIIIYTKCAMSMGTTQQAVDCVNDGPPYAGPPYSNVNVGAVYKQYTGPWINTWSQGICGSNQQEWQRSYDNIQDVELYATMYQDQKPKKFDPECPQSCPTINLGSQPTGQISQTLVNTDVDRDCRTAIKQV